MKAYSFKLRNNQNISKKTERVVRSINTIFTRRKVDFHRPDDGDNGFIASLPYDIYQEILDIPDIFEIMRIEAHRG